ncbi:flavin-containing monooxygenase [Pseudonocardia hispaniensis]|uniref:Flavin-containing monooxygenase n=1 Tax=Pseudonocardia hispaniensis TaxID=904933 RepID=A0ABW1J407_9PSEU
MNESRSDQASRTGSPTVAVIGAGFSGIAAGIALRKQGIEDFVIFERSDGVGGTWWVNRYPGAEVDLESHIYSFSHERYDWTRTHAGWREIYDYLEHVARKWGLLERIRLGENVESVVWSEVHQSYTVTTSSGEEHGPFRAVISAVGFLNTPIIPPFARDDSVYEGEMCHTSTWRDELDLGGKAVGVVGTGSSAVQVVAEAERQAESVKVFQLEPNWLLPKDARDFTPLERRLNRLYPVYAWRRLKLYLGYDLRQMRTSHARVDGRFNKRRRKASLEFIRSSLAGRPDLLEHSVPDFPFEARRTVVSDTYYPALRSPKVTLVPHGVTSMTATGVVDASGEKHDLDMVVLATGFDAANYLGTYRVVGENGTDLHEQWNGEPEAMLGIMVPNFPNFFMMFGPNTNAIPLVTFYEAQAAFSAKLIKRLVAGQAARIRVRRSAYLIYNDWLQSQIAKTVWVETDSYFRAGSGRIVSQWPFSASAYLMATKVLRRIGVIAE